MSIAYREPELGSRQSRSYTANVGHHRTLPLFSPASESTSTTPSSSPPPDVDSLRASSFFDWLSPHSLPQAVSSASLAGAGAAFTAWAAAAEAAVAAAVVAVLSDAGRRRIPLVALGGVSLLCTSSRARVDTCEHISRIIDAIPLPFPPPRPCGPSFHLFLLWLSFALARAQTHIVTHPKLLLACASKAEAQHCHVHSAKLLLNLPWLRGSLGDTRERTCSHEAQAFLPSRPICPESERLRHTPKKARQEVLGSCCRHAHYRDKYRLWRSALTRASALFRRDACSVWTQPLGPHRACCALLGRWGADLHARVGKSVSDARS